MDFLANPPPAPSEEPAEVREPRQNTFDPMNSKIITTWEEAIYNDEAVYRFVSLSRTQNVDYRQLVVVLVEQKRQLMQRLMDLERIAPTSPLPSK